MKSISRLRGLLNISQRLLAVKAGISYKSLQLIEGKGHDAKLSTLEKISLAFRYPKNVFVHYVSSFFRLPQDSVAIVSRHLVSSRSHDWKIPFFNFVDQFRKTQDLSYVSSPPCEGVSPRFMALMASVTEALCLEMHLPIPWWCAGVSALKDPYFVSEVENLKAMSLVESPPVFRKRNIFVLNNFLERA